MISMIEYGYWGLVVVYFVVSIIFGLLVVYLVMVLVC